MADEKERERGKQRKTESERDRERVGWGETLHPDEINHANERF